ncbi:MAG: carboxypeptidase regulatory-like domain-containing protein [Pseudomonadota bacterium]
MLVRISHWWRYIVVVLCYAVTACSGGSNPQQMADDPQGVRIEGRIFDAVTGEGIRDAIVRTDPPSESVTTNTQGNYTITDTVNGTGTYQVIAAHNAYETAQATITATEGSASQVDLAMSSNTRGLHASASVLQFTTDNIQQTLLLTSNVVATGYSIATTNPWVSVSNTLGEIINRETVPITVTVDPSIIPTSLPASSQIIINSANGTRSLVITVQVTATGEAGPANSRQLDCRQTDVLRFGLDDPNAPLIQFPESMQLPQGQGTRIIGVPNPFLIDSIVLSELGIVKIEHLSGGPEETSLELFELGLDSKIKTIAYNRGTSATNRRASLEWALVPGVYCYYLGGTTANLDSFVELEVRISYTSPP